ncbi:PEP/pyruvate-binding domain-containing protein [Candidatus Woesearchaeota archaeon]|nr:PEP/pyruvate-binding domain-containing protein [Candidatus Woesearchaeota archaeon]
MIFKKKVDELAKKYKGRDIIVRSDSLREDSMHSFAGIYDSVVVKRASKKKLINAVTKVYASLNSEKAKRYRQEHNIPDDKMGIIIQRFIEPYIAGIMYTSNSSYPSDLTIEYCDGRFDVIEEGYQPTIKDFEKRTRQLVFESEDCKGLGHDWEEYKIISKVRDIGIKLEKIIGPSDIEFVVKNKKIYLVQRRDITDLEEPEDVKIPKYDKEQYIGFTDVMRGKGKVTLPVVAIEDMHNLGERVTLLSMVSRSRAENEIKNHYDNIMELNEKYKDGYILLTPHFDKTVIKSWGIFSSSKVPDDPTLDRLTPNKKAVITTRFGSICSHIMTVARERGIAYAGFEGYKDDTLFEGVHTGDILSIYFKKRRAYVYKEKIPVRSIKETHPKISIKIKKRKTGIVFETPDYKYLDSHKPVVIDFEYFLNNNTDDEWKRTEIGDHMGTPFTNTKGISIYLGMAAHHGISYMWWLDRESCIIGFEKPLSKKAFNEIEEKYVKHIKNLKKKKR